MDLINPWSRFSMSTFHASRRFCLPAVGSWRRKRSCERPCVNASREEE